MLQTITYFIAGAIVLTALFLAAKTNILKGPSTANECKYSFSRVQMMWWTVIISSAFIILFGKTGNYNIINQSTLILLSISLVTTAGGSLIDVGQQKNITVRHQDLGTHGFFQDILSDENGVSMHRFQSVLFNVLFGITFLISFWKLGEFPEFNTSELSLIGVSSGAYLALKTNENKQVNPTPKA